MSNSTTTTPTFSLFKRANGIWYVAYFVGCRRFWKSTRCTQKRAALQAVRSMDLSPAQEQPKPKPIPRDLNTYLNEFLVYAKATYRRKTYELYDRVGQVLASLVGLRPLAAVPPKVWDDFTVVRMNQVSAMSVNIEQRALKALMNKAVEWEYIPKSPFAKSKKIRVADVPPRYFTKEEFDRLLHLAQEEWLHQAIIFSISTGIRRGELINLRWTEVDLARRMIMIQSSPSFRVKGNKTRVVPLSSVALKVILRQKENPGCPYVCSLNRRQIDGNWMSGLFRRYVKQAGLYDKKLHWHNVRSSFASWLVSGGVSLYAVSKLLGHSSTMLTQTHYARLAPETLHSTVESISGELREVGVKQENT